MNQVATQQGGQQRQVVLSAEQFKNEISLAAGDIMKMLPAHVEFDKFQGMVINTVVNNPKLLECSQQSLIKSVIDSADVGLSINPTMREADILPVWSPRGMVAQFRPRAIGYMKLARQSGEITHISAHEVYEHDHFDYEYGLNENLVHKPLKTGDRGAITHGYCVWTLKDGTKGFEVIDRIRIDKSRAASEGWKYAIKEGKTNSVWHLHEGEMVRKTAVRAASKYFPMSNESEAFLRAMRMEDSIDGEYTVAKEVEVPLQIGSEPTEAGQSQVKALEGKLGVGGEAKAGAAKGEPQTTAPAAAASQEPTATATRSRRTTKAPTSQSDGSATTASRSEAGGGPPPGPPLEAYDNDERNGGSAGAKREEPKPEAPKNEPQEVVDWKAEAQAMRKRIVGVGDDLVAWKKFINETGPARKRMKDEAPQFFALIEAEIATKESWLQQ